MKKFFSEFKAFISQGNVMNLAVGVIIGGAFSAIVTSLIDNIINPLIHLIGGSEVQGKILLSGEDNFLDYGAFISAIINFVIMALIIFLLVKAVNKAMTLGKKKEEEIEEVVTKTCPFCKSEIAVDAVKCPHCTSDIPEETEE